METVTLARNAMATRFEIVLHGERAPALRSAGEEALDEIDRLESRLSLYRPGSEIAQVNARAAREPVRVTSMVFALLQHAKQLHRETGGMFDVTIAPLVRCWGFMGGTGQMPEPAELMHARELIGMEHVLLDEVNSTVRFDREGVMLDLGAIGKGFAVGRAGDILREAGITSALIHGGTSTVCAIGKPPDNESWKIAIEFPPATEQAGQKTFVHLRDEALSVSAVWGRSFKSEGKSFGHVLDPRTGRPVANALLAAVASPSATETDALSTALLIGGMDGHDAIAALRPGLRTLVIAADGSSKGRIDNSARKH